MGDSILESIRYFNLFKYPPTKEEIYYFLKKKASFDRFLSILEKMPKNNLVNCKLKIENYSRYTLPEYSKNIKLFEIRRSISQSKLNNWRFKAYIKLISFFPQIKLIGLSGSISMTNAKKNDDIDLFVISANNRLFTTRFITIMICYLFGIKRSRRAIKDKVCLNLFIDESNLTIPKFKQTEYVAHEVLQMKPIIDKNQTYKKFLKANEWVRKIFPNSTKSQITNNKSQINIKPLNLLGTWNLGFKISNKVEFLLKNLQLFLIDRHKTTEIITDSQLWFHPKDFGELLSRKEP